MKTKERKTVAHAFTLNLRNFTNGVCENVEKTTTLLWKSTNDKIINIVYKNLGQSNYLSSVEGSSILVQNKTEINKYKALTHKFSFEWSHYLLLMQNIDFVELNIYEREPRHKYRLFLQNKNLIACTIVKNGGEA